VVSGAFAGLNRIRQHQLVFNALKGELESEAIHALALQTALPPNPLAH
jgi:stress-induced morphogen